MHKLANAAGYHIFMTGLSGVTTVHIHLFGISVIDVFFVLPLGLKQYAVQGLCMLMWPSHTCSFQLPRRNGAKTRFAATSNNMSNGKIAQVLYGNLKKREEEIIQDWVEMAPNKRREVSVRIERRRVLFHCVGFKCFFYCVCV